MSFKLVIFDLDNTLVLTKPAAKIGYKQAIYFIAKMNGLDKSRDKLYHHWKRIVQELLGENKPHKRRFAYSLQVLMEQHHLPDTYYLQALNLYEKEMLKHLQAAKGAKDLLSSLSQAKLKLAVSTGSERKEALKKLKEVDLFRYINFIVTSSDVGSMKPNPQYYLQTLSEFDISPQQTLVIGDSRKEDLDPAVALGLTVFLVTPQTHLIEFKSKIL